MLSGADRAALAACCQAWTRWVDAEERLQKGPALVRTPSGYVQQSLWYGIANKQLEIMGRYMAELGLSPSARARLKAPNQPGTEQPTEIRILFADAEEDGTARAEPSTTDRVTRLPPGSRDL